MDEAQARNKAGLLKGIVGITPVTEETFLKWRAEFEAKLDRENVMMTAEYREKLSRPTGRQLFERDASLYMDDDVGFNDAGLFEGEEIPSDDDDEDGDEDEDDDEGAGIDASLFQTFDDFPDEDSDEDPDFKP